MRIVCSWCRGEGHIGIVGEKAPLEDRRETHGICVTHRIAVQTQWNESIGASQKRIVRLVPISVSGEGASSEQHGRLTSSATHLWMKLKNLTRKTGS